PEWYMHPTSEGYRESVAFIRQVRGNPDAEVTIYRAVPKGVKTINPGDWVTPSREYAQIHGESNLNNDYDILERKVTAKEVIWPGDYLPEWGWFPDNELGKRLLKALRLVKHYGPGEHPGTGTPQTVHGADRSGFPEVDRLIEDFLKEPLGDWTTDECLIGDLTPEQAHGACQEIAEQFADFVNARAGERGYRAYATQTDL